MLTANEVKVISVGRGTAMVIINKETHHAKVNNSGVYTTSRHEQLWFNGEKKGTRPKPSFEFCLK